jgi:NADPH:quinone reductase-like Zn-dependent oxidoreductase
VRAVVLDRFGGPEVLSVADLPDPEPGPGEIRVRVAAATVNPSDVVLRSGALGDLMTGPLPYVPGLEAAGIVEAAGAGVRWRAGDPVVVHTTFIPHGRGTQAELVVVGGDDAAAAPREVDLTAAATLPMNGLTVRLALDTAALAPGATVAVTGAAGAVGGFAVQLAAADGLRVVGVAGRDDEALVRSLGAGAFVPRGDDAAARVRAAVPDGVDALIDAAVVGAPMLAAVRDGGQLVELRRSGARPERGIAVELISVRTYLGRRDKLEGLVRLVEAGRLTLRVARTYAPEHVADAHRALAAGGTRGRLVVTF